MKIYKLKYSMSHTGHHIGFHASRAAAMGFYNRMAREIRPDDEDQIYLAAEIGEITFEPNKKGILAMLATETPGLDNG